MKEKVRCLYDAKIVMYPTLYIVYMELCDIPNQIYFILLYKTANLQ
jgi:hypothetical protein